MKVRTGRTPLGPISLDPVSSSPTRMQRLIIIYLSVVVGSQGVMNNLHLAVPCGFVLKGNEGKESFLNHCTENINLGVCGPTF